MKIKKVYVYGGERGKIGDNDRLAYYKAENGNIILKKPHKRGYEVFKSVKGFNDYCWSFLDKYPTNARKEFIGSADTLQEAKRLCER